MDKVGECNWIFRYNIFYYVFDIHKSKLGYNRRFLPGNDSSDFFRHMKQNGIMKPNQPIQILRLSDASLQKIVGEYFSYRYSFVRSQDSRSENEPSQEICPHCGEVIDSLYKEDTEAKRKKTGVLAAGIIGGVILIAVLVFSFGGSGITISPGETDTPAPTGIETTIPSPTETAAPTETVLPEEIQSSTTEDLEEQALITLEISGEEINDVQLSPDEKTIAFGVENGIFLYSVDTLQEDQFLTSNQDVSNLIWSAKGQYLASGTGNHKTASIQVWDLETSQGGYVTGDNDSFKEQVQWPDDDPLMAFDFFDGISLWDSQSWTRTRNIVFEEGRIIRFGEVEDYGLFVNTFSWPSHKEFIVVSYGNPGMQLSGAIILWDPKTGSQIKMLEEISGQVHTMAISNNDSILAAANPWNTIKLFNLTTYMNVGNLETGLDNTCLDWSPDDQMLVTGSDQGYVNIWDPDTGEKIDSYYERKISVSNVVWVSSDQVLIQFDDNSVIIWRPDFSIIERIRELEAESEVLEYSIGSTKVSQIDGIVQSFIPAGIFEMGGIYENEEPVHTVFLDAYWLDQTEITADQFNYFMDEADYSANPCREGNHPVACVTWFDAQAYCDWAGRRLPTEAEWSMPPYLDMKGKEYPSGTGFPDPEYVCKPGGEFGSQVLMCPGTTAPVGYYAPDMFGLYDMEGNVQEWVADWYSEDVEFKSFVENPQGPETGKYKISRGSHWLVDGFRADARWWHDPGETDLSLGFRCAESIP